MQMHEDIGCAVGIVCRTVVIIRHDDILPQL